MYTPTKYKQKSAFRIIDTSHPQTPAESIENKIKINKMLKRKVIIRTIDQPTKSNQDAMV
jgi:hypothetical protein